MVKSFRRNVKFVPETGKGLRDKEGYKALLAFLDVLEQSSTSEAKTLTLYLLSRFVELRNASRVPLSQISRLSLEQYDELHRNVASAEWRLDTRFARSRNATNHQILLRPKMGNRFSGH